MEWCQMGWVLYSRSLPWKFWLHMSASMTKFHTALQLTPLSFILDHTAPIKYQLCFKVFSCVFVFISLSLFDCVSPNNVAILYKKPLCICLEILSSWLSPSPVCSPSPLLAPLALTPLLSSLLILPLAVLITLASLHCPNLLVEANSWTYLVSLAG